MSTSILSKKESVKMALANIHSELSNPVQNIGAIANLLELAMDNPKQMKNLIGLLKKESDKLMDITVDIHNQMIN